MDFAFTAHSDDFMMEHQQHSATSIGHDILDIGSRKGGQAAARRQRSSGGGGAAGIMMIDGGDDMSPAPINMTGMPGQFDLPNVDNVSYAYVIVVCVCLISWRERGKSPAVDEPHESIKRKREREAQPACPCYT